jgi:fatty-acyl-CoA synthase
MYTLNLSESCCPAQADQALDRLTVGDVLRTAAAKAPDAPALREVDKHGNLHRRWTYAELLADSERLAQALLTRYRPGERVAVWAPNIPEWVIAEFAMAMAGLVLVTVNPAYQPRELKFVLEQSGASGLFLIKEHRGNPMASIAAAVVADIPAIREVVDMEEHAALFHAAGPTGALPGVDPRDAVQIQYTSGTTGFPKGVVLHHQGIVNNPIHSMSRARIPHGGVFLQMTPLFHTSGCVVVIASVARNQCIVLLRIFDPARATALIESEGISSFMAVPTMLVAMLEADNASPRQLRSVNHIISGGSMVPPELVRQTRERFGCSFQIVYGQTETSPVLTMTWPDDSEVDMCQTIGQPLPQTEIAILDPRTNAVMPIGGVGEICARGYSLMLEYHDNPDATASTIDADGWLHTGDLGTMDARGYLKITGRVKEMIIRGGENLFPAEIENILLEHADVAETAVVGVPDPKWGEAVAAFVRLTPGAMLDPAALVAHCRANLSAPKTPTHWIEVSEWPMTGSGKIQKFVLRDRWVAATSA